MKTSCESVEDVSPRLTSAQNRKSIVNWAIVIRITRGKYYNYS
jgi:hypothetical protein